MKNRIDARKLNSGKMDFESRKARCQEGKPVNNLSTETTPSCPADTLPKGEGRVGVGQKVAFTLAEVLITLSIIGVVAAITLPVIINKINDIHFTAQRKKALSVIEQVYLQIYTEQGIYPEDMCSLNDSSCFGKLFTEKLNTVSEIQYVPDNTSRSKCIQAGIQNPRESHYCVVTSDGISYDFDMEYTGGSPWIYIDVNSVKKPNKYGKDTFCVRINNHKFYELDSTRDWNNIRNNVSF